MASGDAHTRRIPAAPDPNRRIDPPGLVSRRAVLLGLGGVVLSGCARNRTRTPTATGTTGTLSFQPANVEVATGDDRLAFAIFSGERPLEYRDGVSGTLTAEGPSGRARDPVPLRGFPIVRSAGGDEAMRRHEAGDLILVARLPFDVEGPWSLRVDLSYAGRKRVEGLLEVAGGSKTVAMGHQAVNVPTPTFADHRGVEPVCTRVPPCSMHDTSLDQALTASKPTVITFATPALCRSRMCGPDVDVVESVHLRRPPDATFVHVEIYKDTTGQTVAPAVAAWKVDEAGEPWVFVLDAKGMVTERLSGPIADWEVDQALDRLAKGA